MRLFFWIVWPAFGIIFATQALHAEEAPVYDAHGKRDPFIPLVNSSTKTSVGLLGVETVDDLMIEGVVYDPARGSIVIVNGTVLKEGEQSANVVVREVRPDGAVFSVHGVESFKSIQQKEEGRTV